MRGYAVSAHRQSWEDAAETVGQQRHHLVPVRSLGEHQMEEHDRRALADIAVVNGAEMGRGLLRLGPGMTVGGGGEERPDDCGRV